MNLEFSPLLYQLPLIVFLLFANGFFVSAEFALVSVRKTRIEELITKGNRAALIVKKAIHDPDRFIAATQLGITIASLGLGWIAEPTLAHLIEPLFHFLPENAWCYHGTDPVYPLDYPPCCQRNVHRASDGVHYECTVHHCPKCGDVYRPPTGGRKLAGQ